MGQGSIIVSVAAWAAADVWVWSPAQHGGLGLQLCYVTAAAHIQSLAWEIPYAMGVPPPQKKSICTHKNMCLVKYKLVNLATLN